MIILVEIIRTDSHSNGVTPQVSDKIAEMLRSGRRYFGSAGASLSHHVNDPEHESDFRLSLVRRGMEGERNTSYAIRKWMEGKDDVVLIDSVHIRGMGKEYVDEETGVAEGGDTDHVLIIGNSVVIIDTKRWKSQRKYSVSNKNTVLRQGRSFPGGIVSIKQARHLWRQYLGGKVGVSCIVCINQERVFVPYDNNWKKAPFRLVTIENLKETLDHKYESLGKHDSLNADLVSQIVVCAIKPYDPMRRVFDMEKIKDFK